MPVTATIVFAAWTAIFAILMSVFALADNTWPSEVDKVTFGKRGFAVALYVFTIIAGSLTMWDAWRNSGFGAGGGSMMGY